MVYNLKNNYKTFTIYKENVLQPRAYFIPFGSLEALGNTDILTERYKSDRVTALSGQWDFAYFAKRSEIGASFDTEQLAFDRITVPSCWQYTGYEPPCYINARYEFDPDPPHIPEDCSVGIYRKLFSVDDAKAHYSVAFLGVAGALDIYLNGHYVGYSEGSHNTAEFELDEFLIEGENELVAVVHKFSNGTYLECQDMFRNNGIFRDVLLYKTGDNSIYDFELKSVYKNGKYDLAVLPSLKLTEPCVLTVSVEELGLSKSVEVSPEGIEKITFEALEVAEWSAEIPHLYTVLLTLSRAGEIVEIVRRPFGFKHIDIKGNLFYFNNKKIKLLGVNHHDTDAKKGYAMSVEDMERDVRVFKEYNVNCVRTSHYPPDPVFLDLCDLYGIYIIDEADIETHGCETELHRPGACSHNKKWAPRYLDRVLRMFARDKNHPGITMWSLGNEAWGYKNQDACYELLKTLTEIPVHYEGVVRTRRFAYDVISQMYPWQGKMKKLADGKGLSKKWYEKPYFLCEYAHAMGLGAGELETYVSDFLRADHMMGGCIWEFCDHAVYHEDGPYRYTYGGDHGEKKHDNNFCVDGLFDPERKPHAGALQMKNCYRPVRAKSAENGFTFKNLQYFAPVDFLVKWQGMNEKGVTEEGEFTLSLAPQEETTVPLGKDGACYVFRYMDGEREVASEKVSVKALKATPNDPSSRLPITANFRRERAMLIFGDDSAELGISVYRAPLDNDRYLNKVWEEMRLPTERILLKTQKGNTGEYILSTDRFKELADTRLTLKPVGNGSVDITLKCKSSKPIPFAPRFGLTLQLPRKFENVRYFGLGERQNLPDFSEHAMPGEYAMKVDEMREKYIMPQESSMRCGVLWAEVTDENGHGLRFETTGTPIIFSADHFTSQQCAAAGHQEELELQNFTYLHLDAYQLGAASGICGPPPTKNYRRNNLKGCALSVRITVI